MTWKRSSREGDIDLVAVSTGCAICWVLQSTRRDVLAEHVEGCGQGCACGGAAFEVLPCANFGL